MKKGDCFYGDIDGGTNVHYWLVLCAPKKGQVALVNFTTGCGGAKAQKVAKSFFDTLDYDSELAWFESVIRDHAQLEQMIQDAVLGVRPAMPEKKVETVLAIAGLQGLIPKEISNFLKL